MVTNPLNEKDEHEKAELEKADKSEGEISYNSKGTYTVCIM